MFSYISGGMIPIVAFIGIMFAFVATCFCIGKFGQFLPKDAGRDYAVDGKLSAGKPRGAGFIFIIVFLVSALLFVELNTEIVIYLILLFAAMMTGFLDDAAKAPWGEYKKGLLDLFIAIVAAVTYLKYNPNTITIVWNTDCNTCMGVYQCYQLCGWCGWIIGYVDNNNNNNDIYI